MENSDLLNDVIMEWSFFTKTPSVSVPREALQVMTVPQKDLVSVIQGVRRCGKSTLLAQIMEHYGYPRERCFFVNFEDPRLADSLTPDLLDRVCDFGANRCHGDEARYYFFDEIQNVDSWPKWFHRKLAHLGNEFYFVSGSNAALLSGRVASALTGRHITTELFPFSLKEHLRATGNTGSLETYFQCGGFPRMVTYPEPAQLLRQYVVDIVERDVRRNLELSASTVLMQLVKLVFESVGSEVSQRSLARTLGISPDTVGVYLAACEAAYLVLCCPYFTYSEKQRLVRNRKYYPIDIALRHALVGTGRIDNGKHLETMVFLHLRRHFSEVSYWRGNREVDFVIVKNNEIVPIQVTWDGELPRHRDGLNEFYKEFPKSSEGVVIDKNNFHEKLSELG